MSKLFTVVDAVSSGCWFILFKVLMLNVSVNNIFA